MPPPIAAPNRSAPTAMLGCPTSSSPSSALYLLGLEFGGVRRQAGRRILRCCRHVARTPIRRRQRGRPRRRRRILGAVDGRAGSHRAGGCVSALLVDVEGHRAGFGRDRERRAEARDAAQAGRDARQLGDVPAVEGDSIEIRNPVAIGDEIQRPAVRGPLRVDMRATRTCPRPAGSRRSRGR